MSLSSTDAVCLCAYSCCYATEMSEDEFKWAQMICSLVRARLENSAVHTSDSRTDNINLAAQ